MTILILPEEIPKEKEIIKTMPPKIKNECMNIDCSKESKVFGTICGIPVNYCKKHNEESKLLRK